MFQCPNGTRKNFTTSKLLSSPEGTVYTYGEILVISCACMYLPEDGLARAKHVEVDKYNKSGLYKTYVRVYCCWFSYCLYSVTVTGVCSNNIKT